jgi:hypothetical protein
MIPRLNQPCQVSAGTLVRKVGILRNAESLVGSDFIIYYYFNYNI